MTHETAPASPRATVAPGGARTVIPTPDRRRRRAWRGRRRAPPRRGRPARRAARATMPARGAATRLLIGRRRQPRVVVDDARVAALMLDDRAERLERRRPRRAPPRTARLGGRRRSAVDAGEHEHARGQQHRQRPRDPAGRCPSASRATRSPRWRCRPRGRAARPSAVMSASVLTPDGVADRHQRLGQRARRPPGLHERAVAGLHVEHQRRRCPRRSSCS